METNTYYILIAFFLVTFFLLDVIVNLLNLSAMQEKLPAEFNGYYDDEKYLKSQKYTKDKTKLEIIEGSFDLVAILLFWNFGGFSYIDNLTRSFGLNYLLTGILFIAILYILKFIVSVPFNIYDTFVLEQKYGFNKTTPATFLMDIIKSHFLLLILGVPFLALIIFFFKSYELAWLWAWIFATVFSLALMYLMPKYIMPLFNKFTPLEDGELKTAINALADDCKFPLNGIFVIDGSRRSSKSNAFFTGIGKNKKIALYDTLIKNHTTEELVAVLAHEIGHFKKKHVLQMIIMSILQTGALLYLFNFFLNAGGLYQAFGTQPSIHCGLVFYSMLFMPISQILAVVSNIISRKNEFEADAYASEAVKTPDSLILALKKLVVDNLGNLTPHKIFVFLNYSHPPVLERIQALRQLRSKCD